jgi:hypothetical protein
MEQQTKKQKTERAIIEQTLEELYNAVEHEEMKIQ